MKFAPMTNRRHEKISRLIQKELSFLFLNEAKKLFGNAMISVTRVVISPDMGHVKVYVSFLNVADTEKMLEIIRLHIKELRLMLGQKLRNELRRIPELAFYYDDTLDYMEKMDEVFKKLNIPKEENNE